MRSKILAVVLSSAVAVGLIIGLSEGACLFRECIRDDAAIIATALLGIPLLVIYAALSWLVVFPSMLFLCRNVRKVVASGLAALSFSIAFALFFHRPGVDGSFYNTALHLVPWLTLPWFVGGIVAMALWPEQPNFSSSGREVGANGADARRST